MERDVKVKEEVIVLEHMTHTDLAQVREAPSRKRFYLVLLYQTFELTHPRTF